MANNDSNVRFSIIQLGNGQVTIVDLVDSELDFITWHLTGNTEHGFHVVHHIWEKGHSKALLLHRIIMARVIGRPLDDFEHVDHRDGNGLNNTRANLRIATHTQNMQNRKRHKNNKSGYKGVYRRRSGKWRAAIRVNGKYISLGSFDTPEEAYAAYCKAAIQYHGEFARFE